MTSASKTRSVLTGLTACAFALVSGIGSAAAADGASADVPETQVDASKGGFTVRSGDNSLTFGAYVQVRGFLDSRDLYDGDAKDTLGYGKEDPLAPSFDVARVRLSLKGTMFKPWVKYMIAVEAGRTPGESDNKIKDAYVELGERAASVRAGQYKVPFALQELVPDWGQQFVDRSVANTAFAPSRDTGVVVLGTSKSKKLGYALGGFNGSGESKRQNNSALMWVVRLWADPHGEYKLTEGALDAPKNSVLHMGVAIRGGDSIKGGRTGVFEDPDAQTAVGLELAWKKRAFALQGEAFWQRDQVHNPTAGPDVDSLGCNLQAAYMLLPKHLELGARFSQVDANSDLPAAKTTEIRGGVNYFWKGSNLKLSSDFGSLTYGAAAVGRMNANRLPAAAGKELVDLQWRVQLQLYF